VALLRAVHQLLDCDPKVLDDPISVRMLDSATLKQIMDHPERASEPWLRALRAHVVSRSRYAEDRLAEATRRGIRQVVILGAGFDTFAYRQPEWARQLRIFEADHLGTQQMKRERLAAGGIEIPPNLEFVSIDFESVSLRDGLKGSRLDFSQPTLFSCLGVLVYLSQEAVHTIFRRVTSFPETSEIVFTFSLQDAQLSERELEARAGISAVVESLGEPWRTHFDPQILIRDLRDMGFSQVGILAAEEEYERYFAGRGDGLRPSRRSAIASAIVGPGTHRKSDDELTSAI
jgi:methyltransferase (TIGR00027 family)